MEGVSALVEVEESESGSCGFREKSRVRQVGDCFPGDVETQTVVNRTKSPNKQHIYSCLFLSHIPIHYASEGMMELV